MKNTNKSVKTAPKKYSLTKKTSPFLEKRILTAGGWMKAKLKEIGIVKKK